jgi:excinuclease ABC subunit B
MAVDLTDFFTEQGVRVRYMHSDVETLERVQILRDLRDGKFDVLVGINLLREGLDLPEVSLVAILDADKEGFLRSRTALIQTFGRAARNEKGHVILYADRVTKSMQAAMDETDRRRDLQRAYNLEHGITPTTTKRSGKSDVTDRTAREGTTPSDKREWDRVAIENLLPEELLKSVTKPEDLKKQLAEIETRMRKAARELTFEEAASLRDQLMRLKQADLLLRDSGGVM